MDLTNEALVGYSCNANPHIATSPAWYAHKLGEYLHTTARGAPRGVRMSRGNSIRASDMLFKFRHTAGNVVFERIN